MEGTVYGKGPESRKPYIGESVQYFAEDGQIKAAIVVYVWPENDGQVNLHVFNPSNGGHYWVGGVSQAEPKYGVVEFQPDTWFWPPLV